MSIVFVNRDEATINVGKSILNQMQAEEPAKRDASDLTDKRDDDFGVWPAERHGDVQRRTRIFVCDMGKFRDSKNYRHIADFADDKTAGYYVRYMRDKKRYADKDIVVQEIIARKGMNGETIEVGKILGVIAVTGESLPVGEYTFS